MIIVMKSDATKEEVEKVISTVKELGYKAHIIEGVLRTVIGAVGDERGKPHHLEAIGILSGVEKVVPILQPYKLASREFKSENTVVKVGNVEIGDNKVVVMAGPCSVENEEQIIETSKAVKEAGATVLRGGAYKPLLLIHSRGLARKD